MLIHIEVNNGLVKCNAEFVPTTFKNLNLMESHVEEFIRKNIQILFAPENSEGVATESLLIVGQQVINLERARTDLVAVDGNGHLVLIEIKRDVDDIKLRKEPFEFQAIRYAASLATLKTPEQLVEVVYTPYVHKYRQEEEFNSYDAFTSTDIARKKLEEFLKANNAFSTFNLKQRIVLVSSGFDPQTLSAVSWLIANNVDIQCFTLTPGGLLGQHFLELVRILPPTLLEENYVGFKPGIVSEQAVVTSTSTGGRQSLPDIKRLFEVGLLKAGDILAIRGSNDSEATVVSANEVDFRAQRLSFNKWGQRVKGWTSINIYQFAEHKERGKTLDELRSGINASQNESEVSPNVSDTSEKELILDITCEGGGQKTFGRKDQSEWVFWSEGSSMDLDEDDVDYTSSWNTPEASDFLGTLPDKWISFHPLFLHPEFASQLKQAYPQQLALLGSGETERTSKLKWDRLLLDS